MLEKAGYDVHLFLMQDKDAAYDYGGKIHRISFFYKSGSLLMTLFTLQHIILTWYYKKKLKIDVSISVLEFANIINLLTPGKDKKIPTLHNYMLQCEITPTLKDRLLEWLFKKRLRKAHRLVVVAEAIKEKLEKLYDSHDGKITAIHNSVNIDGITELMQMPLPKEHESFFTPNTFVNASRHVEQKSLHTLVLAFAKLAEKNSDARLVLIGEGHLTGKLKKLAKDLDIADRVLFTGFTENPFCYIKKAKAFVFSSYYEGFGLVVVESLCCGTPVISTDCNCGPREILAPGTCGTADRVQVCEYGILTPPGDGVWTETPDRTAAELSIAMELAINDKELYEELKMKAYGRSLYFSAGNTVKKWIEIIEG